MLKLICSLSASSVLLLASFAANASPITITSSYIGAYAYDGVSGAVNNVDSSTAFGSRSLLSVDGANSSSVGINWLDTTSGALLDFDMDQTRDGHLYSIAQAYESSLYFTADENTTYNITGQYTVDDVTTAGRSLSDVFLQDLTASNTMLFRDFNYSDNTVDESFTVGIGGEGDASSTLTGSQTGNLFAGHNYRFYFSNYTQAYPTADGGASATGCITLSIGGATGAGSCGSSSVPEPMPLTLLGAGLAALGLRRRLRVKVA